MVNIKEITVTLSATIPTGQYANIAPSITWKADVGEYEDNNEVTAEMMEQIKAHLSLMAAKIAKKRMDMNIPIDDVIAWIHATTDVEK